MTERWRSNGKYLGILLLMLASTSWGNADANSAGERPVRIGAVTDSWGPTPHIVGLRDGLIALGYKENADFVLGGRFTQGEPEALPAAARELVQLGAELIFASNGRAAKAALSATTGVPIVFVGRGDPDGELQRSYGAIVAAITSWATPTGAAQRGPAASAIPLGQATPVPPRPQYPHGFLARYCWW